MTLQDEMLTYRAEQGLSQKECANRAKITLQTWMNVERGIQSPSRLTERKIKLLVGKEEE